MKTSCLSRELQREKKKQRLSAAAGEQRHTLEPFMLFPWAPWPLEDMGSSCGLQKSFWYNGSCCTICLMLSVSQSLNTVLWLVNKCSKTKKQLFTPPNIWCMFKGLHNVLNTSALRTHLKCYPIELSCCCFIYCYPYVWLESIWVHNL